MLLPWIPILTSRILLYCRIMMLTIYNFMITNHLLTTSHHHLPPPLPSSVLWGSGDWEFAYNHSSAEWGQQNKTSCFTSPTFIVFPKSHPLMFLHKGIVLTERRHFFSWINSCKQFCSLWQQAPPLKQNKLPYFFLCGKYTLLYTHLSHLNSLQNYGCVLFNVVSNAPNIVFHTQILLMYS